MSDIIEYLLKHKDNLILSHPLHQEVHNGLDGMFVSNDRNANWHLNRKGGTFFFKNSLFAKQAAAVIWAYGDIAYYPIHNLDVFSFDFSGCVMAVYYTNQWNAAHIQMGEQDCKAAWVRYIANNPEMKRLVMFRPYIEAAEALEDRLRVINNKPIHIYTWGLISAYQVCYTLYVTCNDEEEKHFSLAGIIRHNTGYERNYYAKLLLPQKGKNLDTAWREFWDARYTSQSWMYDRSKG